MALRAALHVQTAGFATPPAAVFTGHCGNHKSQQNKIKLPCYESKKKMRFGSRRAEANLIGRLRGRLNRFILCVVQCERGFSFS